MITPERKELIFNRLKEDYALLEKKGYEVLGVFLYGSDNYGLSDEQSDIDTKAIIIPKFDDLVFNREYVSDTFIENDNSLMDVKDIRFMFKIYLKQNINFLETLFTPYCELNLKYIGYYSGTIFKNAEKIAHYDKGKALKTMMGDMKTKYKLLFKDTPHTHSDIEEYGYSLKEFHHIMRLEEFVRRYISGEKYSGCLTSNQTEVLMNYKRKPMEIEEVRKLAQDALKNTEELINATLELPEFQKVDKEAEEILNNAQRYLIQQFLMEQICDCEKERIING